MYFAQKSSLIRLPRRPFGPPRNDTGGVLTPISIIIIIPVDYLVREFYFIYKLGFIILHTHIFDSYPDTIQLLDRDELGLFFA